MPGFLDQDTKKITPANTPVKERTLFPAVSCQQLLGARQREKLLADIRALIEVPEEIYTVLFQQLIYNFTEFVQVLPVNDESRLASILDEGLFRALFVLQAQKKDELDQTDPLMAYVLFTAALLFDIGFVSCNRSVMISDNQGAFIKQWQPHKGSMRTTIDHYKIRPGGGMPTWLCRHIAVIYARQIMPPAAFYWIAQDPHALNVWIDLLNNESKGIEEFRQYFDRANGLLEDLKLQKEYFIPANIDILDPAETLRAEEFLEWLQNGLADNSISINDIDSNIYVTEEGLLLETPGIFKQFSEKHEKHPEWKSVFDDFKKLGLVALINGEPTIEKYIFGNDLKTEPTKQSFTIRNLAKKADEVKAIETAERIVRGWMRQGIVLSDMATAMIFHGHIFHKICANLRRADELEEKKELKKLLLKKKRSQYPTIRELLLFDVRTILLSEMMKTGIPGT